MPTRRANMTSGQDQRLAAPTARRGSGDSLSAVLLAAARVEFRLRQGTALGTAVTRQLMLQRFVLTAKLKMMEGLVRTLLAPTTLSQPTFAPMPRDRHVLVPVMAHASGARRHQTISYCM